MWILWILFPFTKAFWGSEKKQLPFIIEDEFKFVTCGSSIKLTSVENGFKLHSHSVSYGNSGSGQQSVTGFKDSNDANSYFTVRGGYKTTPCSLGQKVACNSIIRLYHSNTKTWLHSHLFHSPLSSRQEVSAFGGKDSGDDWLLECEEDSQFWKRESIITLKHVDTNMYLSCSDQFMYQSVIPGQLEVSAVSSVGKSEQWTAQEGIYFGDSS
jgi:dolichyl-phosphate-mannose--protein O-mannosyl transferase